MKPWLVIQHVAHEGPGLIAAEAAARGITLDIRLMDRGDPLPDTSTEGQERARSARSGTDVLDGFGGLVVMGGPMGVYEAASYPHIASEMALLHAAVARELPVLGVCLGAQLLAGAMGARVYKGPASEIGFGSAMLTEEGRRDPVLGPDGPILPAFHWHGDTFDLPPGAVHLARSEAYPNQAFRIGGRVYAVQFHIEPDSDLLTSWRPHLPASTIFEESRRLATESAGRKIIRRFFDVAIQEDRGERRGGLL